MKKFSTPLYLIIFSLILVTSSTYLISSYDHKKKINSSTESDENEMYDGAAMYQKMEYERTKDPATGLVPKEELITAMYRAKATQRTLFPDAGVWTERGPNSDVVGPSNGNLRPNNDITSGRIRAIWIDLTDASGKTVWVGGVDGGLWKTTDITAAAPNWTIVNDFLGNMAISSICQDPVNKNIMYFGTGESYFNFDAVSGAGIFKSTDFGVTWNQLGTTSAWSITKVLCDAAGNIYAGTQLNGLQRSSAASGGAVWTQINPAGFSNRVADFEISSTGRLHLTTGLGNSAAGTYRYANTPSTATTASGWTAATVLFPYSSGVNCRVELGCSGNTLYALSSDNGNPSANVPTLYKSTDGGDNWAATGTSPGFTSGQAWYCLAVDINPADPTQVIVGSLDCYKTTDGGATWNQISTWIGGAGQYVHADQHAIKWFDNGVVGVGNINRILFGCDGGIHYSADSGTTIRDRNTNLRIKQYYSCAVNPNAGSNIIVGGAQDNGMNQLNNAGLGSAVEVIGGDGGFSAIDQSPLADAQYEFGSYVFNRYRRSTNTGTNWSTVYFLKGAPGGTEFGSFINAYDYDNTANVIYAGGDANEYFRWLDPQTRAAGTYYSATTWGANASVSPLALGGGVVTAVTVSPYLPNTVYFGSSNGHVFIVTSANGAVPVPVDLSLASGMPAGSVSSISVGTSDNNLMVTFSNFGVSNVWTTSNAGALWTAQDGTGAGLLPNMPVRFGIFSPGDNTKAILGTEAGVWITGLLQGNSTSWAASATFPTVRTDMLRYRASDGVLTAATHGRGMWQQNVLTVLPLNNFLLKGKWNNDNVELSWDYANPANSSLTSFEIQSSVNGKDFTAIGSNSRSNMSYTYKPASSNMFYRIMSVNSFGGTSYSNIIHLQKGSTTRDLSGLKIFPNPVKGQMKITFSITGQGGVTYQVTNMSGQVVWKKQEDISLTGDYIREWNMQMLRPGSYVLTISNNTASIKQQFTKQ